MAKQHDEEKMKALREMEGSPEEAEKAAPAKESAGPKVIDGYRVLERHQLPFGGSLYPISWNFAYKCPTAKQVANFSTMDESNQPAIIAAIEELVKENFVIVDSDTDETVSTGEINDGERLFFFLLLREFYLHDKPISYTTISQNWQEPVSVELFASRLSYKRLGEKLLECFDGRVFTIPVEGLDAPIAFRVPTFNASGKIFRHIVKVYRDSQGADEDASDKMQKDESFNKQFLLIAPFLFVTGNETVEQLKMKFKGIQASEKVLGAYLTIINKLNFTNLERLTYEYKGAEEETLIRFPGGWKSMFVDKGIFGDLFD
jgi:hypothetical protein